jgi:competence protein ComEC
LSYLALFFIVWAQPLLAKIWNPNNKIIRYLWDIITVSTAAQIGTLPISIYYFHQFSGLFFITNCIILPFLSVIMGVGILVLLMALTTYFWQPILKLMELLIALINYVIHYIASFDELVFKEIPLTKWMMFGLYFIIFTWIIYLKKPNFTKLSLALFSIIIFQATQITNKIEVEKSSEFIVFSKNKSSLFVERNGKEITLNTNTDEQKNVQLTNYLISNFAEIKRQKKIQNFYLYNGKKIVVIDSSGIYLPNSNPDILIVIQSPKVNLETILRTHKPKQIVADASNYKSYVALWKATCKKQNIPFHAVAEKGYFKIE